MGGRAQEEIDDIGVESRWSSSWSSSSLSFAVIAIVVVTVVAAHGIMVWGQSSCR
jgi:nitrate reductase NapE component